MAQNGVTKAENFTVEARKIDFVTRFTRNWDALREILGVMRPIRKQPGTKLTSYEASITLESGDVGEGEVIPFSEATVAPVAYGDIKIDKYAKAVTLEAVDQFGAEIAIQRTDEAFLRELQNKVMTGFYTFAQTGTNRGVKSTFQAAIADAIGKVKVKFEQLHRDATNVVVFVNTTDYWNYLGSASLTLQTVEGINYIKGFMGASTVIITSDIPQGKVIAIPEDNIVLYYVDPADSNYRQLGLQYTVQGETNLIGFGVEGNFTRAQGEEYAVMGMKLWAEYLDAIAIVYIGTETAVTTAETLSPSAVGSLLYPTAHLPLYSVQELKDGDTAITKYTVTDAGILLDEAPTGTVTAKYHYVGTGA